MMSTLQNTHAEWTCGHVAGSVCAECYRILAQHASDLAAENIRLKEERAADQRRLLHYDEAMDEMRKRKQP